jgi:fatty-acid desaturase
MWIVLFGNFFFYRKEKGDPATIAKYTLDWQEDILDKLPGKHYAVFGGLVVFSLAFGWVWGPAAWFTHAVAPAWPVIRLLEGLRLAKVRKLPMAKAA